MTFLWVGHHRCLDFLNTEAMERGRLVDRLQAFDDLVRWLRQAGAMTEATARSVRRRWGGRRAGEAVLAEARRLRSDLRRAVAARAGGTLVSPGGLARLNGLLRRPAGYTQVTRARTGYRRRVHFSATAPRDLLIPVAEAAAHLLCEVEPALLRKCASPRCVLLFVDRTKNRRRRWCSAALCGNRARVAAHYRRRRARRRRD